MTEAMIRKKAGMASVKDMPLLQDGPPPGGFAPVRFARRIPSQGPSAMTIFLATVGVFSWGMYQVGKGNKIRRAESVSDCSGHNLITHVAQAYGTEFFHHHGVGYGGDCSRADGMPASFISFYPNICDKIKPTYHQALELYLDTYQRVFFSLLQPKTGHKAYYSYSGSLSAPLFLRLPPVHFL